MKLEHSVLFSIKGVCNQIKRLMALRHSRHGPMTGMQHAVISYVSDREEAVFQRDIERFFNVRRSTATGILQLMEKNGFILREPVDHDLRLKRIVLTERAAQFHRKAVAEIAEFEQRITEGIPPGELESFFRVMAKVSHNIEANLAEAEAVRSNFDFSEDPA